MTVTICSWTRQITTFNVILGANKANRSTIQQIISYDDICKPKCYVAIAYCMGKFTQEKIESILVTYDKTHSFAETGKIEKVDARAVKKHVEQRKAALYGSKPSAAISTAPSNEESTVLQTHETRRTVEEIYAEAFKLHRQGKMSDDIVIELKIKPPLANKIQDEFLTTTNRDYLIQALEEIGRNQIEQALILFRDMIRQKKAPSTYLTDLSQQKAREEERHKNVMAQNLKKEEQAKLAADKAVEVLDNINKSHEDAKNRLETLQETIKGFESERLIPTMRQRFWSIIGDYDKFIAMALALVLSEIKKDPDALLLVFDITDETLKIAGKEHMKEEIKKRICMRAEKLFSDFCFKLYLEAASLQGDYANKQRELIH